MLLVNRIWTEVQELLMCLLTRLEDRNAVARQPIDVPLRDTIAIGSVDRWLWTAVEKPCCYWSDCWTLITEDVCWWWSIASLLPRLQHDEAVIAIIESWCFCCSKSSVEIVDILQLYWRCQTVCEVWVDFSGRSQCRQLIVEWRNIGPIGNNFLCFDDRSPCVRGWMIVAGT